MTAPVDRLLRVTFLTAANLGAAAGEASLDRPTQKGADSDLPYVPDSALKGVLAGELGDVGDEETNPHREPAYGSPDRADVQGRASQVVFGNAELLCFPFPTTDGGVSYVFPAQNVGRLLWLEESGATVPDTLEILAALEPVDVRPNHHVVAAPSWPALDPRLDLQPLRAYAVTRGLSELVSVLTRYAGREPSPDHPFLIVSARLAGRLWNHAAEIRAATALAQGRRVAADATLRSVELIPEGSVFISLLSQLYSGLTPSFPAQAQLGAGEGSGRGWATLDQVAPATNGKPTQPTPRPLFATNRLDEAQCMIDLHQAVSELRSEPELYEKARSAAQSLGGRMQYGGLEAALAFELAKAKPAHVEPSIEARAHRWLLAQVFSLRPESAPKGSAATLLTHVRDGMSAPGTFESHRDVFFARWLWLRRFLEARRP